MVTLQFSFHDPIPVDKIEKFQQILNKNLKGLIEQESRFVYNGLGQPVSVIFVYDGSHLKAMFIEKKLNESLAKLSGDIESPNALMGGLGLFMVNYRRYWAPILLCMVISAVLAYLQVFSAGVNIQGGLFDEGEGGVGAAILNGLVPVLVAAIFMTCFVFVIKKFGMKVLKIFFGVFILFYVWWGSLFYTTIILYVMNSYQIVLDIYFYASIILVIAIFVQYVREKLPEKATNTIVLLFSAFFGALLGSMLPTLSFIIFVALFSIWDIIAVLKGPLGKLIEFARDEQEAREIEKAKAKDKDRKKSDDPETEIADPSRQAANGDEIADIGKKIDDESGTNGDPSDNESSTNDDVLDEAHEKITRELWLEEIKHDREKAKRTFRDQIHIGIGNGDLLFYSAFVVHTVVVSKSIITAILVIFAIFLGAKLTFDRLLDILIKHELGEEAPGRQLPGLPLSMGFGIVAFLLGQGIELLLSMWII